ncbi:MAG: hypothetical protein SOV90_00185, partial [Lachnospiraceae bacterium]|nr:hypothetical protein [Lachnospiraceae bacterium]
IIATNTNNNGLNIFFIIFSVIPSTNPHFRATCRKEADEKFANVISHLPYMLIVFAPKQLAV